MKIQVKKRVGKVDYIFDIDQQDETQAFSMAGFHALR